MGHTESKTADNSGDANVQIVNRLDAHTDAFETHQFILWVILALVALQLTITLYQLYVKREKRNALKAAHTVAQLTV